MLPIQNVIELDIHNGCHCFRGLERETGGRKSGRIPENDLTFPTLGGGLQSRRCWWIVSEGGCVQRGEYSPGRRGGQRERA